MLQDNLGDLTGKVHLVIAGGYDDRVTENVEHYLELRKLAADLKLDNLVTFLCSVSDDDKLALLSAATCLLYTPDREHFGIVPVEAMYLRCPVIAVNSGGPLETVDHEVTGYLCEQTGDAFSKAMNSFVENPDLKTSMGKAGRARMINLFSFETYSRGLNRVVDALTTK
ncbi:ALG2 [Bugula neritina]|uniref:ALG2 n=1 Tax=Bugula neritina TaxID=10212 RepID=A0A7J7JTW2_BUGNE|nr:ALG2 [Bugula neritina]